MHRRTFLRTTVAAPLCLRWLSASGQQREDLPDPMTFGHLRGRFVYDGRAPKPRPIRIRGRTDDFDKERLVDESLLVHAKNKGLANVVIWLETPTGEHASRWRPHKSYDKTANDKAMLEYRGGRITPRVVAMRTTQTLKVVNSDMVINNCAVLSNANPTSKVLVQPGRPWERSFDKHEPVPIRVVSHVYPWMSASIAVRDNPYYAVTSADGSFEIRNIPAGDLVFRFWHEQAGSLKGGNVNGKQASWPGGRFMMSVRPGTTDLGEIRLSPKLFR